MRFTVFSRSMRLPECFGGGVELRDVAQDGNAARKIYRHEIWPAVAIQIRDCGLKRARVCGKNDTRSELDSARDTFIYDTETVLSDSLGTMTSSLPSPLRSARAIRAALE